MSTDHVTSVCHGGPLDGQTFTSRCPKGFLVVNRPVTQVVIYDFTGIAFAARPVETEHVRGDKNRYRAALEPNYDVVAYDPERMGSWE